jgi:hypothetical protein
LENQKMSNVPTLAQQWQKFRTEILPLHCGMIQLIETRRAFYAGAAACMSINCQMADEATEEEGVAILDSVAAELKQFGQDIEAGRA